MGRYFGSLFGPGGWTDLAMAVSGINPDATDLFVVLQQAVKQASENAMVIPLMEGRLGRRDADLGAYGFPQNP